MKTNDDMKILLKRTIELASRWGTDSIARDDICRTLADEFDLWYKRDGTSGFGNYFPSWLWSVITGWLSDLEELPDKEPTI